MAARKSQAVWDMLAPEQHETLNRRYLPLVA
jgi:hypothetical protein